MTEAMTQIEVAASMRPGQSCPGVGEKRGLAVVYRGHASMRPGQSCPGVVGDPVVVRLKKDGLQ